MFNVIRDCNEPEELLNAKESNGPIPTNGELYESIKMITNNHCYLCESQIKSRAIEHVQAHKRNPVLKYEWNNLLLACTYCNELKNYIIDSKSLSILNPSIQSDDVEKIKLIVDCDTSTMDIQIEDESDAYNNTRDLLNAIYNGYSTAMKKDDRMELMNEIDTAIYSFDKYMYDYRKALREYKTCGTNANKRTVEKLLDLMKHEISRDKSYFMVINCYVSEKHPTIYEMIKPEPIEYGDNNE